MVHTITPTIMIFTITTSRHSTSETQPKLGNDKFHLKLLLQKHNLNKLQLRGSSVLSLFELITLPSTL